MPKMAQEEIKKWAKGRRPGEKLEIEQKETSSRSVSRVRKEITKL